MYISAILIEVTWSYCKPTELLATFFFFSFFFFKSLNPAPSLVPWQGLIAIISELYIHLKVTI